MDSETEQLLATLELLTEPSLPFDLPGHEDGGYLVPFVWDVSERGEFNVLNLSYAEGWLQLTDINALIQIGQYYLDFFPIYAHGYDENSARRNNKIKLLLQLLSINLEGLEALKLEAKSPRVVPNPPVGIVVGRTKDGDWIAACPTVYKATEIPEQYIARSPQSEETSDKPLGKTTLDLIAQIEAISSDIGVIHLEGDFGGGYCYAYDHQIIYTVAQTKELVFKRILQLSGILEINQFHAFYPDKSYFEDDCDSYETYKFYLRYEELVQFLNQSFDKILMYRFSFWSLEYIYIIGQTQLGNEVGLHLASEFIYNP
ncbi:nuclease A inhibitor family protein [Aerosakkonemataceae cyanobacterium BLCC-F50]|uniref:Nuclease A inhibitor family protein n=1 Tax=Floridaenema flaviceps BLCC-F50 TaxID=3153642 RepID=A0ABV4XSY0_9CYAN